MHALSAAYGALTTIPDRESRCQSALPFFQGLDLLAAERRGTQGEGVGLDDGDQQAFVITRACRWSWPRAPRAAPRWWRKPSSGSPWHKSRDSRPRSCPCGAHRRREIVHLPVFGLSAAGSSLRRIAPEVALAASVATTTDFVSHAISSGLPGSSFSGSADAPAVAASTASAAPAKARSRRRHHFATSS